ncbi:CmcJ/NvfI family oxidoreductase [Sphingobium tyrosinilyticum]|uniref:CmcJ/NvfI family oxidoreductase n=1 Tax=Sphingobium tyrosinilyticum TaxID=2715436 RepID=A0ABV9F0W8_9SPHN
MPDVTGVVNYLSGQAEGRVKYTQQRERSTLQHDAHSVLMHDIRNSSELPTLEREGFMVASIPLDPQLPLDARVIAEAYNPAIQRFLQQLTGAPKIVLRAPILRWSRRMEREQFAPGPADYVHGDFAKDVFHDMAKEAVWNDPERDRWLAGRYAVVQTWRALSPPPQDFPLALVDRRTVSSHELVEMQSIIGAPGEERSYSSYSLKYNPRHRWSYLSNMTQDDVLVFIGSESDNEMPGILHSSFDNTPNITDPVPRTSCELRAFVYWG